MSRVFNRTGVSLEMQAGEIVAKRESGMRVVELASEYGVDRKSIQRVLKWMGKEASCGRPDNGLNMFEEIRDEHDAYWLGFLMGDSHVMKNGNGIMVGIIDKEHVEKLKKHYSIPAEISTEIKSLKNKNWSDMYTIGIYSQRSVGNAGKWGLVHDKNKRFIPDLKPELMRHFWRGLWDADGCIRFNMTQPQIVFVCKEQFVRGFRKWLGVEGHGRDDMCGGIYQKAHSTWAANYSGMYAKLVCEKLYKDCKVSLDRKKIVADRIIKGAYMFSKQARQLDKKLHKPIEPIFEPLEKPETEDIVDTNP